MGVQGRHAPARGAGDSVPPKKIVYFVFACKTDMPTLSSEQPEYIQPPGAYRFSADAPLLAAFAAQKPLTRFADLGTGCGIVALEVLRLVPQARGLGLDICPQLLKAAHDNSLRLGMNTPAQQRLELLEADVAHPAQFRHLHKAFDLVLANPPWRVAGTGRMPPDAMRRAALFGSVDTLEHFALAGRHLLLPKGRFATVISAERLPDMLAALHKAKLHPARLQCVHAHSAAPAAFVLVEALKGQKKALRIEAPHYAAGQQPL